MNEDSVKKEVVVIVRGIPYLTFSSEATLTGRWKIIEVDGYSTLYIECKYTLTKMHGGCFPLTSTDVVEFIPEERIQITVTTEYPIQECSHE